MKYGFRVYKAKVEKHEFWAVESTELKGCAAQGETLDEAMDEFETNEKDWIDTAKEAGIKIPEIHVEQYDDYSGKLSLRLSKTVHRELAEIAQKEGVSINSLINTYIAKGIGNWMGEQRIINVVFNVRNNSKQEGIYGDIDKSWENYYKSPVNRIKTYVGRTC